MNWSVVAIFVTLGIAQAGLVVGLIDRLFKAELRLLSAALAALKEDLEKRDKVDDRMLAQIQDLEQRIHCLEMWKAGL